MKHIHLPGILKRVVTEKNVVLWRVATTVVVCTPANPVTGNLIRGLQGRIEQVICSGGNWSARLVTPIQKDIKVRKLFKRRKEKWYK